MLRESTGDGVQAGRGGHWGRLAGKTHLAAALTVAICATDIAMPRVNWAILLALPLALQLRAPGRRMWQWTSGLILLNYVDLALKVSLFGRDLVQPGMTYRLINRSFVGLALFATALIWEWWWGVRPETAAGADPGGSVTVDRQATSELSWLRELLAFVLGVILAIAVFVLDLTTPFEVNYPILYLVPLLICATGRSRLLVWCTFLLVVGFSAIAFLRGPGILARSQHAVSVLINHQVAVAGLLGLTILLHLILSGRAKAPKSDGVDAIRGGRKAAR